MASRPSGKMLKSLPPDPARHQDSAITPSGPSEYDDRSVPDYVPALRHGEVGTNATDACQFFYDCMWCGARLKPKRGDCCVFCSYGSLPYGSACLCYHSRDRRMERMILAASSG